MSFSQSTCALCCRHENQWIDDTFLRLLRQVVHAFSVTVDRDIRFFGSTLSLTTGSRSMADIEDISAVDGGFFNGESLGLEGEGITAGELSILIPARARLMRRKKCTRSEKYYSILSFYFATN